MTPVKTITRSGKFILGLFYGALGSLILYNFILFLVSSSAVYLYYVIYQTAAVIFHMCYNGLTYVHLSGNWELSTRILQIALIAIPIFAIRFIELFCFEDISLKLVSWAYRVSLLGVLLIPAIFALPVGAGSLVATGYICVAALFDITMSSILTSIQIYSFVIAWAGALGLFWSLDMCISVYSRAMPLRTK